MTLKQERLVKEVLNPENKTMLEAGRKAGFKSNDIYRKRIKAHILAALEAQGVTKDSLGLAYKGLINLCIKKEDLSTAKGALDSLGKLNKLLQDNNISVSQGIISPDVLNKLRARLGNDVTH